MCLCTFGSLIDIETCEVSLHPKVTKGQVMDCVVFVYVSGACCMLHPIFLSPTVVNID